MAAAEQVQVLVIDDDAKLANAIAESLERKGYAVTIAANGKLGTARLRDDDYDIILTDLRMNDVDGLAIVKQAREMQPDAEVAVITGYNDVRTAQEALKLGASHYLMKPIDMSELRAIVEKSAERVKLARANKELRQQLDERFGFEGVIGNSPKMARVLQLLKAYAPAPATVLVLGEAGTGKELAAKALHVNSARKNKPFVALNCAALNDNLLDDEMFGHEAGSFTGGDRQRKGRFEHANGGTLFLDEIGDMPLSLQAKLLRVLENGEVVRIGANDPIKIDVRLVAATNKDLEKLSDEGKFRWDLYMRLKVGVIRLPSLRERKEDIPLLVNHFIRELTTKYAKRITSLSEPVWRSFANYRWPGNVRELRNILESMVLLDHDGELGLDDFPEDAGPLPHAGGGGSQLALPATDDRMPMTVVPVTRTSDPLLGKPLVDVERYYTERALEIAHGNREVAATMLGIGERTLYRNLQKWKKDDELRLN
jgi:two-component system, NtrC family, response regulator HydG